MRLDSASQPEFTMFADIFPSFFAQIESAIGSQWESIQGILPLVLLFLAMWFLIIAPQRKKQKAMAQMIESLGVGDEIITTGGIYGTITNRKDDRFVVKIADNTKIEINKSFVQSKVDGDQKAAGK
jgi:preprotein translocase subunit YajC